MKKKIFSMLFALVLVLSFSLVTAVPAAAADPTTLESSIMTFEGGLIDNGDGTYSGTIPLVNGAGEQVGDGVDGFDNYARNGAMPFFTDDRGLVTPALVIAGHDAYPEWPTDVPDYDRYALKLTADSWSLVYCETIPNWESDGAVPMSGTMDWNNMYAAETDVGYCFGDLGIQNLEGTPGLAADNGGGAACWDMDWVWGSEVVPLAFPGFAISIVPLGGDSYRIAMMPAAGPSPPGPVINEDTGESYGAIQPAIDAPETDADDTISVAAGIYSATTENSIALGEGLGYCFVHIDKSISLIGESRDGVILDGSQLFNEYRSAGIWVSASDVTIKNFTIQNFYVSDPDHYSYGLVSWEKFRNFNTAEPEVLPLSYVTAENLKVVDCQASLYFMMTEHATVKDCVVENSLADGIWVAMGSSNATVQGNIVTNSADHGIWVGGASWCPPVDCPNATITDNTINGAREGGISSVNSDGAIISGNTITNAAAEGWSVGALSLKDGCSNVEAYDNTIYNNDGLWGGYSGTGHGVGIDGTPSNINLYFNNIYDNTGDGCHNYSTVAINATNNWWGAANGPGQDGANDIFGNVDYSPWLGAGLEESESETVSGSATISETSTGGDVTIDASGKHTITTAKYEENPGGSSTFEASGNYYDVHLDNDTGVDSLTVEFCPATESTIIYYWDGSSWIAASEQTYGNGCIVVTITASTHPSLSDLAGLSFASGTPAAGPLPVGGTVYPPNKLALLAPWIVLGLAIIAGAIIILRRRRAWS